MAKVSEALVKVRDAVKARPLAEYEVSKAPGVFIGNEEAEWNMSAANRLLPNVQVTLTILVVEAGGRDDVALWDKAEATVTAVMTVAGVQPTLINAALAPAEANQRAVTITLTYRLGAR